MTSDENETHPLSELVTQLGRIPMDNMGPIQYPSNPVIESVINDMLERFASRLEERQSWLASTSHDLRSPITAIIANAELAMDEQATPDDLNHAVNVAYRNATRLAELMDAFMEEATRLGGHGLPMRPLQPRQH